MRIEALRDYVIKQVYAHGHVSYARSDKNDHFLWGDNRKGQCTLVQKNKTMQLLPYLINDIFIQLTGKRIHNIRIRSRITDILCINE